MPTAPKLIALLIFAGLAYLAAELYKPQMPPETYFGPFSLICAAIGGITGWLVMAGRTGLGAGAAISAGIQTSITLVFFALLGFSIYMMIRRAMRGMYGADAFEAVINVFSLMMKHGALLLTPTLLVTLLLGGAVGGLVTDWVAKRWS